MSHWIIVPVILPGLVAAAILLLARGSIHLHRVLSLTTTVVVAIVSFGLVLAASWGSHEAYWLGSWPPPFGIVLVLDRLSALLVATTSIVALASVFYAAQGWDEKGANFHALFQFQLMGLNGAFLTGDLFNLFVFFEVLLIASYGLLLHGGGKPRVRAGVHYVLINLTGSAFFVLAVALLYGLTGTLNMADLAVRVAALPAEDAGLVRAAGLLLMAVFSVKAALLPLHFWLPGTYGSASAPVAALFAIMTKVGGYSILRMYTLVFGEGAGHATMLAEPWILPVALVTVTVGMLGALASRDLRGLVAFLVLGSVGTMMVAVGLFNVRGISAGLYYFAHSTVAAAALFLLVEMVGQQRGETEGRLEPAPDVLQPRMIGGLFMLACISMVGLPPLSGFIGKLLILDGARHSVLVAWVWAIVLATSLIAIIAAARAGSIVFWKTLPGRARGAVASSSTSFGIVGALVGVTALMTLFAGPITDYTDAAAAQLLARHGYIQSVLGTEALAAVQGGPR